ncbi:hypothetical protein PENTCL1PPCAC_9017, partial [Pristionchus entomophagus]
STSTVSSGATQGASTASTKPSTAVTTVGSATTKAPTTESTLVCYSLLHAELSACQNRNGNVCSPAVLGSTKVTCSGVGMYISSGSGVHDNNKTIECDNGYWHYGGLFLLNNVYVACVDRRT